jgi:hypothetical protein
MQRLYEWLCERASVVRAYTRRRGARRIVRTETIFEHRSTALLLGAVAVSGLDACPLCGSSLASAASDQDSPSTCPPKLVAVGQPSDPSQKGNRKP